MKPIIKLSYLFGFISLLSFSLPIMFSVTAGILTIFLSMLFFNSPY
jgi:hypothetical protein